VKSPFLNQALPDEAASTIDPRLVSALEAAIYTVLVGGEMGMARGAVWSRSLS
jgi:hypothetical protein